MYSAPVWKSRLSKPREHRFRHDTMAGPVTSTGHKIERSFAFLLLNFVAFTFRHTFPSGHWLRLCLALRTLSFVMFLSQDDEKRSIPFINRNAALRGTFKAARNSYSDSKLQTRQRSCRKNIL